MTGHTGGRQRERRGRTEVRDWRANGEKIITVGAVINMEDNRATMPPRGRCAAACRPGINRGERPDTSPGPRPPARISWRLTERRREIRLWTPCGPTGRYEATGI